tara:strand:- start:82619 stop:82972 length:354 start_codon:yes stop_codon:yes gene_type:complete
LDDIIIFHNPRCSKSRQTLEIIRNKGIEPIINYYLEKPPKDKDLKKILLKLNLRARDLIRKGEPEYKEHNLSDESLTEDELRNFLIKYPKLIERPIVVYKEKAIIGRPPENVLNILD